MSMLGIERGLRLKRVRAFELLAGCLEATGNQNAIPNNSRCFWAPTIEESVACWCRSCDFQSAIDICSDASLYQECNACQMGRTHEDWLSSRCQIGVSLTVRKNMLKGRTGVTEERWHADVRERALYQFAIAASQRIDPSEDVSKSFMRDSQIAREDSETLNVESHRANDSLFPFQYFSSSGLQLFPNTVVLYFTIACSVVYIFTLLAMRVYARRVASLKVKKLTKATELSADPKPKEETGQEDEASEEKDQEKEVSDEQSSPRSASSTDQKETTPVSTDSDDTQIVNAEKVIDEAKGDKENNESNGRNRHVSRAEHPRITPNRSDKLLRKSLSPANKPDTVLGADWLISNMNNDRSSSPRSVNSSPIDRQKSPVESELKARKSDDASKEALAKENEKLRLQIEAMTKNEKAKMSLSRTPYHADMNPLHAKAPSHSTYSSSSPTKGSNLFAWTPKKTSKLKVADPIKANGQEVQTPRKARNNQKPKVNGNQSSGRYWSQKCQKLSMHLAVGTPHPASPLPPPPPPPPPQGLSGEASKVSPAGRAATSSSSGIAKSWEVIKKYQDLTRNIERVDKPLQKVVRKKVSSSQSEANTEEGNKENESSSGSADVGNAQKGVKEELEGRSSYMKQVMSDRSIFEPMILDLIPQIQSFAPQDLTQVEIFVAEVDRRLALLSDERMVLKGFAAWPEKKLEVLREVTGRKQELERLVASMDPEDDRWIAKSAIHEELQQAVDKFESVKPTVEWYIRSEEEIMRNYKTHSIPFDFKLVKNVQIATVGLAKYAMQMSLTAFGRQSRAEQMILSTDLVNQGASKQILVALQGDAVQNLLNSALKFSFRVHQFAGGFDAEATGSEISPNSPIHILPPCPPT
ncbi:hypothetical protein GUITHDRAFT_142188 [Guillardia theta CCMP2712]|uniref:Uncharacterized protein n=1 Tax=Guillardia theta (strain CCMP2712) TaxID=905079 RepID=L1IYF5_GUITC|nr:hypothetical protein GUITHDRAFT_142188 [Guillardia theta CCMP2712]EKX41283.1 hypothetical protein GUITHDRAFT_142188 [Guillardia theta CCMP2712]|eukprot:XP_005828263.1 hypothetical protein GUITHDRAFT_142188 [Guillardia theta CCMP2712]